MPSPFHPGLAHVLSLLHVAAVATGLLLYVALTHGGRQRRAPTAALAWERRGAAAIEDWIGARRAQAQRQHSRKNPFHPVCPSFFAASRRMIGGTCAPLC